ncbi:hypothetical protein EUTSA_v10006457mg, partial [Eutrema salsugineum]
MDRISTLPNELLCHILSFLTTKEAALTSVLAKRWRNLVAFVPNLDLDDSAFLRPEDGNLEREIIPQSFMDFVDSVFALQGNSPLEKFSLKCKCQTGVDSDRSKQWISRAMQRGVLYMDLFIDFGYRYWLPLENFTSRTLVELKIATFALDFRSGDISLPVLKTLAFDSVLFYNGQLPVILSACPALENLDMHKINFSPENETTLTIYSDTSMLRAFSFDTPNLVCLKYTELVADDYPLVNLGNLVEAHIELKVYYHQMEQLSARNDDWLEDDVFLRHGNVRKLVRGISNVHKLYLSPGAFQVLALCSQAMPVFNNLTFLDIDSTMDIAWQAMPVLLRHCPNLDTLVIKRLLHCVTDKCGDACICISREEKGRSLVSCPVKRLEIRGFDGITRDLEMIKHFLDYLPCLEEMEIYITERGSLPLYFRNLTRRCSWVTTNYQVAIAMLNS